MRKRIRLAEVENPQGRVDVALYRIADRFIARIEGEQGLKGLRENVLPIVEDAILRHIPAENLIPREIQAVIEICRRNQGRERR